MPQVAMILARNLLSLYRCQELTRYIGVWLWTRMKMKLSAVSFSMNRWELETHCPPVFVPFIIFVAKLLNSLNFCLMHISYNHDKLWITSKEIKYQKHYRLLGQFSASNIYILQYNPFILVDSLTWQYTCAVYTMQNKCYYFPMVVR